MNSVRIRKRKEKRILGARAVNYIYLVILSCCLILLNHLHPCENINDETQTGTGLEMIYIFHDYAGNQYFLNESTHGASSTREYLFDTEIPEALKEESNTLTIDLGSDESNSGTVINLGEGNSTQENSNELESKSNEVYDKKENSDFTTEPIATDNVKDNQISLDEIMNDLGDDENEGGDTLVINGDDIQLSNDEGYYDITKNDDSTMVIEWKEYDDNGSSFQEEFTGLSFNFLNEGIILPILIPRDQIDFLGYAEYNPNGNSDSGNSWNTTDVNGDELEPGIHIVDDYADCMTPWGYKIQHGESVLAYQQLKSAPNICNIERRFCWNGKLSGTYSQQGCSENPNYSYDIKGEAEVKPKQEVIKGETKQNSNGSVTVTKSEIGTDFLYERPSRTYTYDTKTVITNKIVEDVDQTERTHRDCKTPRGEKVIHGQFIYAYKHANGFSDSPCEMQIRLCSMGQLNGTYTNAHCKTWDTSFIDWINGSPTRDTYSKEKLNRVKEQIKAEKNYDKDYGRITDSDALDKILYILEK